MGDQRGGEWRRGVWLAVLVLVAGGTVQAQPARDPEAAAALAQSVNSAALWRQVRQGGLLKPAAVPAAPTAIVQAQGERWRALRQGPLTRYGGWILGLTLTGIAGFAVGRGRVRIEGGRSGRRVVRFTPFRRLVHWFVAVVFTLLALSGLVLLYGKTLLAGWLGRDAFGVLAGAMKEAHNLFGPLFIVGVFALLAAFLRDNRPTAEDVRWFLRGGFLFRAHVPAGYFNGGEKLWFWLVAATGLVLSVSGVLLDFPLLAPGVETLRNAHLFHAAAAVLVIAGALGHVYMGTVGVEGVLEGMLTGSVDEAWAAQHHPGWLARLRGEGEGTAGNAGGSGVTASGEETGA